MVFPATEDRLATRMTHCPKCESAPMGLPFWSVRLIPFIHDSVPSVKVMTNPATLPLFCHCFQRKASPVCTTLPEIVPKFVKLNCYHSKSLLGRWPLMC